MGVLIDMPQLFRNMETDLHRLSPYVFLGCLAFAVIFTTAILTHTITRNDTGGRAIPVPPVIIQLQDIPEIRQVMRTPSPAKPFVPSALPIASDKVLPDTVTIRETKLDLQAVPAAPPALLVPSTGGNAIPSAVKEETEIFESFNVEEQPKRLNAVTPEYPDMARRAGIEGAVLLKVLVNTKGTVDSVIVQKGPAAFQKSAIAAAHATTFTPAKQNGRSVPLLGGHALPFHAQSKSIKSALGFQKSCEKSTFG